MQVPSGRIFTADDLIILRAMVSIGFVQHREQPFTLKSGIQSNVYVFGREEMTDNPVMEVMVGEKIGRLISQVAVPEDREICLIGIPTAGTPFAQATAMACCNKLFVNDRPIVHRQMKEVTKQHGAHPGWIVGRPREDQSYWLVDNVATNGASKPEAREKMRADHYPDPAGVIIWIDRQQGAVELLKREGFDRVLVAYNLLDITYAFGEMQLWPKTAVDAVQKEIEDHSFLPNA